MIENKDVKSYEIIIVGAGAAGISAAIYAKRAGRKVAVIERMLIGGQLNFVGKIVNYAGFSETDGATLSNQLSLQAEKLGIEIIYDEVLEFEFDGVDKEVKCKKGTYKAKAIILALGGNPRELEIEGEKTFRGRGVSYCVQCDGNFFKEKYVAVVGSNQAAIDGALYLSKLCNKVYLVSRFDIKNFSIENLLKQKNIEIIEGGEARQIIGDDAVTQVIIEKDGKETAILVDGIFVVNGNKPNTALLSGKIELSKEGFIICDEAMQTSKEGVYACGDVRQSKLKQISTAVGDGAIAGVEASLYVQNSK